MKELTPRQKAFADYYIETGNAEESAIRAGYSKKYARGNAHKLVANSCISRYIAERTRPTEQKRIATGDEVMEFFTSVMKGDVKDAFGLDPSLQDRLNAAKELAKRTIDIEVKKENSDILENMKTIMDVLQNPAKNRNIEDFEDE